MPLPIPEKLMVEGALFLQSILKCTGYRRECWLTNVYIGAHGLVRGLKYVFNLAFLQILQVDNIWVNIRVERLKATESWELKSNKAACAQKVLCASKTQQSYIGLVPK